MALPVLPGPIMPAYADEGTTSSAETAEPYLDDGEDSEAAKEGTAAAEHSGMTDEERIRHIRNRYMDHLFFDPHPVVIGPDKFFGSLFRSYKEWQTWEIIQHNLFLEEFEHTAPFLEMGEQFLRWYLEKLEVSFLDYEQWVRNPIVELVKAADLRSVRQAGGFQFSHVRDFLLHESYPVIVKPLDSAGSDGVKLCRTFTEAEEHFHYLMEEHDMVNGGTCHEVLCQEFLKGKEYVVDHVSRDGVHKVRFVVVLFAPESLTMHLLR